MVIVVDCSCVYIYWIVEVDWYVGNGVLFVQLCNLQYYVLDLVNGKCWNDNYIVVLCDLVDDIGEFLFWIDMVVCVIVVGGFGYKNVCIFEWVGIMY